MIQVTLGPQEILDPPEQQGPWVPPATRARQGLLDLGEVPELQGLLGSQEPVYQGLQDLVVLQAPQVSREGVELLELQGPQVLLDQWGLQGGRDHREVPELQAHPDRQGLAHRVRVDPQDPPGPPECQDQQVLTVSLAVMVLLEQLGNQVRLEDLVL